MSIKTEKDSRYILLFWVSNLSETREYNYLHWDDTIKAPVSNVIQGEEELEKYCLLEGLMDLDNYKESLAINKGRFLNVKNEETGIIANNHAGPNGEHLTWNQILELYK